MGIALVRIQVAKFGFEGNVVDVAGNAGFVAGNAFVNVSEHEVGLGFAVLDVPRGQAAVIPIKRLVGILFLEVVRADFLGDPVIRSARRGGAAAVFPVG